MIPEGPRLDLVLKHLVDLGRGSAGHLGQDIPANSARQNANGSKAEVEQSLLVVQLSLRTCVRVKGEC